MNGILLIDKPQGWTSFDIVNKLRAVVEQAMPPRTSKKRFPVGHTGTLDPEATGLLIIVFGTYTKQAASFSKLDKTYAFTLRLGQTSTTGDEEGEKTAVSDTQPDLTTIRRVAETFLGVSEQIPPQFSAIKVKGRPAYLAARQGRPVELDPRSITMHELLVDNYNYPYVDMVARVSSGTYIRSLASDIGSKLQTGAFAHSIRRLSIGQFNVDEAISISDIDYATIKKHLKTV